jgi:hypothetical protein
MPKVKAGQTYRSARHRADRSEVRMDPLTAAALLILFAVLGGIATHAIMSRDDGDDAPRWNEPSPAVSKATVTTSTR